MKQQILALTAFVAFSFSAFGQDGPPKVTERARQIQASAIVVDTHADTPQRFLDENYDIGSTDPKDPGHISLDKAKAGDRIMMVSYGSGAGSDGFVWTVTERVDEVRGKAPLTRSMLDEGKMYVGYGTYAKLRGKIRMGE